MYLSKTKLVFQLFAICVLCIVQQENVLAQFSRLPNAGYDGSAARAKVLSDGKVYAATSQGVIRVSNDNGFSFSDVGIVPGLSNYVLINNDLYAWSFSSLFKYNGQSFDEILTFSSGSFVRNVLGFDNKIFLLFYDYALVSTDNGATFTELTEFKGQDFVGGSGIINNELFIATNVVGQPIRTIQKYTSNGWESYSINKTIQGLVAFENVLYASLDFKLHQSTDGQNWTEVSTGNATVTNRDFFLYTIGDGVLFGSGRNFAVKLAGSANFVDVDFNSPINPARSFNRTEFAKNGKIFKGTNTQLISYDPQTTTWAVEQEAAVIGNSILQEGTTYYTTAAKSIYKRTLEEQSWTLLYTDTNPLGRDFIDLVKMQNGRLIASQQALNTLSYSDDDGANWATYTNAPFASGKLITRNDSLFAGGIQGLWLSIDNGASWTKVYDKDSRSVNYYESDKLLCSYEIINLSDFSVAKAINTSFRASGFATAYVELGNYSFIGTSTGLFKKPNGDEQNWQAVNMPPNGPSNRPIVGLITVENSLVALTSYNAHFTADEGDSWSLVSNVQSIDFDQTINENQIVIAATDGYYLANFNQYSSAPSVLTLTENTIIRQDTIVVQQLSAEVTPRGNATSVWFEYGLATGTNDFNFDQRTSELSFEPRDSVFTVQIITDTLDYYTQYYYRAVVAYEDKIRYGEPLVFQSGMKQFWERLDEEQQYDGYDKVFISRRGSILAWSGANHFIRSIDNGKTWEELTPPHRLQTVIQAAGDTLFAGSKNGNFMYSTNEGSSWTIPANDSLPSNFGNTSIMEITYDSLNHRYYAIYGDRNAEQNNRAYLVSSTNAGLWWDLLLDSEIPGGRFIRNIHVDSTSVLWLSTSTFAENQPYLFKSEDFGKTYSPVLFSSSNTTREGNEILSISKDTLFFSSSLGAWYSADGGVKWDTAGVTTSSATGQVSVYPQIDYSRKFGIISVVNTREGSFESGFVSLTGKNYRNIQNLSASVAFGNNERPNVRDAAVSGNDMVLIATSNGIWRYIAGASALPENPTADEVFVTISENDQEVPTKLLLDQNYPNPFNPSTQIRFELPQAATIRLSVHNIMGQEVAVLSEGTLNAGTHQVSFSAAGLSTGMYIYRLQAGQQVVTKKMMFIK